MARAGKRRDFDRLAPEARRAALIDATLRCLRREGRDGLSARRIGAEAEISIGLINHYFPSKDDLVAAAYEALADRQLAMLLRAAGDGAPVARLRGFVAAFFGPEILDRDVLRAWIVFWAMAFESAAVRAAHERSNGRFQAALRELLAGARPDLARRSDLDRASLAKTVLPNDEGSARPGRGRSARLGGGAGAARRCPPGGTAVRGAPETLMDASTSANEVAMPDLASRATELSALLDGLWVEWCLADAPFAPAEGRAICDRWIDRFLAAPITD